MIKLKYMDLRFKFNVKSDCTFHVDFQVKINSNVNLIRIIEILILFRFIQVLSDK